MHTLTGLRRLMNSNANFGRDPGSCFGVLDPGRLRSFNLATESMESYRLEFQEGHQLQPEPEPHVFKARNDEEALHFVLDILGLKGQLTRQKFHRAGGAYLFCGDRLVFPRPKKK